MLLHLYHLGCTKYEVWMMSRTLKQKKGYPVHIILLKLDTDIPENRRTYLVFVARQFVMPAHHSLASVK